MILSSDNGGIASLPSWTEPTYKGTMSTASFEARRRRPTKAVIGCRCWHGGPAESRLTRPAIIWWRPVDVYATLAELTGQVVPAGAAGQLQFFAATVGQRTQTCNA